MENTRVAADVRAVAERKPQPKDFDLKRPQGSSYGDTRQASIASHTTASSETDLELTFAFKATHFGAGNIGRGFIGKILSEAGGEVVFADVVDHVIERINTMKAYRVRVVGDEDRIDYVRHVSGLNSMKDDVPARLAESDIITTAVGPNIIPRLASTIVAGIARKRELGHTNPLNIICCENMVRATSILKKHVMEKIGEDKELREFTEKHVGFVDCAVDRIVPPADPNAENMDPLDVTVETFHEWIVDATQFVGPVPEIDGMIPKDNLEAFVERKLFTLNTGHCVTAYLGYLKGHETIQDAIMDESIQKQVLCAMRQSSAVLLRRYNFDAAEHEAYIHKLIQRFRNKHLRDEVVRVAREPIRKLSVNDRLIKPLRGCLEYSLPYDGLVQGIAAALHYDYAQDQEAVKLQQIIRDKGVKAAVCELTQLEDEKAIDAIVDAYNVMLTKV